MAKASGGYLVIVTVPDADSLANPFRKQVVGHVHGSFEQGVRLQRDALIRRLATDVSPRDAGCSSERRSDARRSCSLFAPIQPALDPGPAALECDPTRSNFQQSFQPPAGCA